MKTRAIFLAASLVLAISPGCWAQTAAQIAVDSPYQIGYFSNLNVGDGSLVITNSGASGGNICVNAYVFTPDEELVKCHSYTVTPDGLVTLSAIHDLLGGGAPPPSVVVTLVSTKGSCNDSSTVAPGMLAWSTSIEPQTATITTTIPNPSPLCQTFCNPPSTNLVAYCKNTCPPQIITSTTTINAVSKTPLSPATLSAGELTGLTAGCSF
jgi:hypothetical protein